MAGRHPKGTNDADADGEKGGSLPEKTDDRVERLERELAAIKAVMRRNGWTLED